MADEEEERDDLIDPLIDATAVFPADEPVLNTARRQSFVTDLARKIDPYPLIATRYGFTDEADVADYLRVRPELRRAIKEERAIWFSSENNEVRARHLAQRATVEMIPAAAQIGFNEMLNPSVRLEALQRIARIGGLDGPGSSQPFNNAGDAGGRFSVSIVFSQNPERNATITATPEPPAIE